MISSESPEHIAQICETIVGAAGELEKVFLELEREADAQLAASAGSYIIEHARRTTPRTAAFIEAKAAMGVAAVSSTVIRELTTRATALRGHLEFWRDLMIGKEASSDIRTVCAQIPRVWWKREPAVTANSQTGAVENAQPSTAREEPAGAPDLRAPATDRSSVTSGNVPAGAPDLRALATDDLSTAASVNVSAASPDLRALATADLPTVTSVNVPAASPNLRALATADLSSETSGNVPAKTPDLRTSATDDLSSSSDVQETGDVALLPPRKRERHPGSVWIDAHHAELPVGEWVAAGKDGLVAHNADLDELHARVSASGLTPDMVAIAYIEMAPGPVLRRQ